MSKKKFYYSVLYILTLGFSIRYLLVNCSLDPSFYGHVYNIVLLYYLGILKYAAFVPEGYEVRTFGPERLQNLPFLH